MVDANDCFGISDGVEWTDTAGEIIILDIGRSLFYGVNEVSAEIWRGIAAGLCVDAIVEGLSQEFEVDLEVLQGDTKTFIERLLTKGLITYANPNRVVH